MVLVGFRGGGGRWVSFSSVDAPTRTAAAVCLPCRCCDDAAEEDRSRCHRSRGGAGSQADGRKRRRDRLGRLPPVRVVQRHFHREPAPSHSHSPLSVSPPARARRRRRRETLPILHGCSVLLESDLPWAWRSTSRISLAARPSAATLAVLRSRLTAMSPLRMPL